MDRLAQIEAEIKEARADVETLLDLVDRCVLAFIRNGTNPVLQLRIANTIRDIRGDDADDDTEG